jgi:hypothetical protein
MGYIGPVEWVTDHCHLSVSVQVTVNSSMPPAPARPVGKPKQSLGPALQASIPHLLYVSLASLLQT